uniref:(northern house mosquito) hypothetical protein n=1 Tax=Culex pipiens TaxID=7175 RepID=A0A8D8BCY5_CULPI
MTVPSGLADPKKSVKYVHLSRNPSWWRRRTALEKALTLVSIVCGIAVVALLVSLLSVLLSDRIQEPDNNGSSQSPLALTGSSRRGKKTLLRRRQGVRQSVPHARMHPFRVQGAGPDGHQRGTVRRLLQLRLRQVRPGDQHPGREGVGEHVFGDR